MNMLDALTIACEVLEIRRQQWERVSVPDHCMDGDISDCITDLYEATPEEAAAMVEILSDAAATLGDEREKYAPGGE